MNSERMWILILAAVAFLGGSAAGLLVAPRMLAPAAPSPSATYQAWLSDEFDLSVRQRRALGGVMEEYERRLKKVQARFLSQTSSERAEIGRECRDTIWQVVLDGADRERFDAMEHGQLLPKGVLDGDS